MFNPGCGVDGSAACGWGVRGLLWGLVLDNVYISKDIDLDLRRRGNMKIMAVLIEKWTSDVVPMYMQAATREIT